MEKKLFVTARWDRHDIRKTWSGTGYSLLEGLSKQFQVQRISLVDTWWYRCLQIVRRLGIGTLSKSLEDIQTNLLQREICHSKHTPVFMITGVFEVDNPSYLFMDNIWRVAPFLKSSESKAKKYFDHFYSYSKHEITYHIGRQYDVFLRSKTIFVMGHWLAEFINNVYPEFKDKIYAVGGGCNAHVVDTSVLRTGNKILFVGKAFQRKGGDLVVEAFRILRERYRKDVELIIVGPLHRPKCCQVEGITFKGSVSFNEVGQLMQECDLFCMPSRFEAYGLVFVEALMSGLPCIGRNAFEMPYFIDRGVTGELIDNDDPEELACLMAKVLDNEKMKQNVANMRKEYEKYYNWDRICLDIANIVKKNEYER